ncbi:potassium channel family protein [Nocardiopsis gilva]|uniref:potassium channel family protein n=1 Tax=Nocardiopsis gilva TaxID=280236 RepID=UPI00034C2A43|nr:potassium channel family protein [Nocardiopsis gilva]
MSTGDDALERWRRKTELPLAAAALLFLAAYAWPILHPEIPRVWRLACEATTWGTWAMFVADYLVGFKLARHRVAYLRTHILDLVIILAPFLRPLRALRLITVVSVLNRRLTSTLRRHVAVYAVCVSVLVVFVAALAVLDAERGAPGSNISAFDEALWWTLVTITTVGYGDFYPVTEHGRLIAVALFIGGISLLGVVTGTVASWFTEKVEGSKKAALATQEQVALLTAEVRALRAEFAERDRDGDAGQGREWEREPESVMDGHAQSPGAG